MKHISRRDFLKYAGAGAVGLIAKTALGSSPDGQAPRYADPSDVIECFDDAATIGANVNEPVVQVMMDESIKTLTGINDLGDAWKSLFPDIAADSVISIKVNCASRYCPTTPEAVNCIINGLELMSVGGSNFKRNNVIIWERTDTELTRAGFTLYDGSDPDTPRCFGTDHSGIGYDYGTTLNCGGVSVNPSKIMSLMSDFMINAAVLKDHGIARVTLCLKDHYGSVYDVYPMHGNQCDPFIPSLNQQIRDVLVPNDKQKLFFIDGLFGIYVGGPGGQPNCNPKKLILSKDIVACDYQGKVIINEERVANGRTPVNPSHIVTASGPPYDLGTTDINLIRIHNPTGIGSRERVEVRGPLLEVSPHPVRGRATIVFVLPHASPVSLDVINSAGRTAMQVYGGVLKEGQHRIEFRPGRRLRAGTYHLRLRGTGEVQTCKVTILN